MRVIVSIIVLLLGLLVEPGTAQLRFETLELKSGRRLTGEVAEVRESSFLVVRKVGKGSLREEVDFADVQSGSLYAVLVSALSPLDRSSHRRIGEIAFAAELFTTARRHFLASIPADSTPIGELAERIQLCEQRDIDRLLVRSREALDREDFKGSRRLAMLVMRRYSGHAVAGKIPARLAEINSRYEAARRRDLALERSRRRRSVHEKAGKALDRLVEGLRAAEAQERLALRSSDHFRSALNRFERGIRQLTRVEKQAVVFRRSGNLPAELRARLNELENDLITLHIRMRLHIASLYTVRGSYGSALAWTNNALAYDPTDQGALDSRNRIEEAAAASSNTRIITRFR